MSHPAQPDDDELTARFEREVIPLLDRLFNAAMRLTQQRADAEDLVQETMIRAYAGFRSYQPGTNLAGWLLRIQANAHISGYRKRMRRPTETMMSTIHEWQLTDHAARLPRSLRSAELVVLESLPDDDIRAALDKLPEIFRMAVYYADVEGLSHKEICAITGTPPGTVMSRIHRGRSRLRVLLADLAADRGYVPPPTSRGGKQPAASAPAAH
ncbi:sigma-70 family RNA polymerase sigma factor [Mycolicibacterium confluentis]|uniref:ECF RNA polymerase sigma factor SigH n=1 Tax=Mycolicibacterium confluentis TaxID=28047 RepID=A0A7I7Y4A2_9MYCO|nr:sigma-70 family RNA polymerase sigma factor [Mycolicibacterium confluentis]MCV7319290.1 sigma-70 family RNA polymerase sigma factor [Mycolicibacterium confluentis]ORV25771.1 RNA polymerase subunit sigma [Mycolicibacterium confluentis]BBZ36498.1 ECF RNA polymerase sigma factor SigH [Mycolicibacterium confluentis]